MSADGSVDLRRQVQAHLASLQAAGVLFVPRGAAIVRPEVTAPQAAVVAAATVPEPVDPLAGGAGACSLRIAGRS